MATSKKTTPKKSSTARASSKKPTRSRRGGGPHISQIDAGWFYMEQSGLEVGQVVVTGSVTSSVEYYFLYQSGTPAGKGPYTWPSKSTSPVTTKYTYAGTLPPGWTTPAKYQSNLYPIVAKLVTANCTSAQAKKTRSAR
jgi:hypothetical protein